MSTFQITPSLAPVDASVGALDVRPDSPGARSLSLVVGTHGGDIIEITSTEKEGRGPAAKAAAGAVEARNLDLTGASAGALLHSHFKGELWGLATHPVDPDIYATVGDDGGWVRAERIGPLNRDRQLGLNLANTKCQAFFSSLEYINPYFAILYFLQLLCCFLKTFIVL